MDKKRKFMIFWLGQAVSQLSSSMTAFALMIWAFEKTQWLYVLFIKHRFLSYEKY